ncbi:3-methyladenine DNA glycosylase [Aeromicrobium sp. CTD01-1L150]|uniref:3-methyladenine DNA glycosylase n=1 Tax=Aeromicrobium sp. CTD01-1L150 TaxID=3341830 RepID=UPI0035C142E3
MPESPVAAPRRRSSHRLTVLPADDWRCLAEHHRERAHIWTQPHLARARRREKHPVDDFLFEYYNLSPGQLERWHPGLGVALADAPEYESLGAYVTVDGAATVDPARLERRLPGLRWTRDLLARTTERDPTFGCFGLHEWAMVYRTDDVRHPQLDLRLGADGTADVVDSHQLACTHVDAFRFFTPAARPLNSEVLTRDHQLEREQPGCLHATMDLYRLAFRMLPFIEATVVLDTFELAIEVRRTDMAASPYDLTSLGLDPIPVETAAGKAEYVRRQRRFTERAAPLRQHLLEDCERLLSFAPESASCCWPGGC